MSQLSRNASVAGVVYNGVVPSRNLLQREEQGAYIDVIQGLRESGEGVYPLRLSGFRSCVFVHLRLAA